MIGEIGPLLQFRVHTLFSFFRFHKKQHGEISCLAMASSLANLGARRIFGRLPFWRRKKIYIERQCQSARKRKAEKEEAREW